jgi:adenylate cyclase
MHIRYLRPLCLLSALLIALFALVIAPQFIQPLDNALNDWRTRLSWYFPGGQTFSEHKERRVIIVDIDERSILEQGAWPWPREKVAKFIGTLLDEYAVSGIALDIVFPEEKNQDVQLLTQLKRDEITGAVVYDLIERGQPEITQGLPAYFKVKLDKVAPVTWGIPVTSNHSALMPNRIGHITPLFDSDGSIRHLSPIICHPQKVSECRPLLGIASYMGLLSSPSLEIKKGQGLLSPKWELAILESEEIELAKIPLDAEAKIIVPYRHRQSDWTSISATDILEQKTDPKLLKNGLILVGSTALGMSDVVFTPVSPVASGLEPHAEVMLALLDDGFFVAPQYGLYIVALILSPLLGLFYWALGRFNLPLQRSIIFPLWLATSWGVGLIASMLAYQSYHLLLPLTPFALFPPIAILLSISVELYLSTRERLGVAGLLAAYLPKQVAEKLTKKNKLSDVMDTSVDASRRQITVLFADVRGFTAIAENNHPEVVAKLMHRIFSEMSAAVAAHQGTIDKFIGDAVMAFWNAPDDDPLHPVHALAAAQEMLKRINSLTEFCHQLGLTQVHIGIGMETGYALVGNFGSAHRRTYTALGETVVLASRLEGLTAQYQRSIIVGETCAKALGIETLESLGETQLRGRQRTIALYSPRHMPISRSSST